MLAEIILAAALLQASLGAPTNCAEFCDDATSGAGSYGQSKSSYSSYIKSSSYDQRMQRLSNGGSGARLENLDENVIGGIGLERPGTWRDEKHYVTDDGRGEMSYKAGQTVTSNGYSKFAQHSYRYGTHDSHAPLSNSQVLSVGEFEREFQNLRRRISSFMGNFHLDAGSTMNANTLQEFKNKADLISSQLNSVCNQVDVGSSMYQQMQQMMQQFQRDVERKQQEMEAMITQSSSSTSSSSMAQSSSLHHYPVVNRPSEYEQPQQQQTIKPSINEEVLETRYTAIDQQINTFLTTYSRPDTSLQYQQDLNAQVDDINKKLLNLKYESMHNDYMKQRVELLRTQFETNVNTIRERIRQLEDRNREEELRRLERQKQLELEKKKYEDRMRQLEEERIRLQREEEEVQRQLQEQRLRLRQEEEKRRLEEEEKRRLEEEERQRLLQQQQLHQQLLQRQQQQLQLQQQQQQQQQVKPHVTGTVEVSGSSTYEHTIKGSYGPSGSSGSEVQSTQGSYHHQPQGQYARPESVMQPHIDLTAAMSRLQQDLHRLQTEVSKFNMYTMRLTSSNSANIVSEAERQADLLRQSINNLCETSSRYQNQGIQKSAEELGRRFEEIFRSFQSQAASYSAQSQSSSSFSASGGYSSGSSYSATGSYSAVHAPSISNFEVEHSKSTEIEVGRRPGGASQRLYSQQSNVDCVEMYAGQPCVNQPRRHRRRVGGK